MTAIVDDPQENIDFYTKVLGLRLVKRTVNFDDPYTYHLYYGDEGGRPGTIVTFFPWPGGRRGSRGTGQISAFAFAVPAGSLEFWRQQLLEVGWHVGGPEARPDGNVLSFYDPAGLLVELVERPAGPAKASTGATAITGLHGVTLTVAEAGPSGAFLTGRLGFRPLEGGAEGPRYAIGAGADAAVVTLASRPGVPRGQVAAGTVHHVAWRVADEATLEDWRQELEREGAGVTAVRDRQYFRSIYFREPGGALYELATDAPGFAVDEPEEALGRELKLPSWLEPRRPEIERRLPPVVLPEA